MSVRILIFIVTLAATMALTDGDRVAIETAGQRASM